jgi:hypothetical protein
MTPLGNCPFAATDWNVTGGCTANARSFVFIDAFGAESGHHYGGD